MLRAYNRSSPTPETIDAIKNGGRPSPRWPAKPPRQGVDVMSSLEYSIRHRPDGHGAIGGGMQSGGGGASRFGGQTGLVSPRGSALQPIAARPGSGAYGFFVASNPSAGNISSRSPGSDIKASPTSTGRFGIKHAGSGAHISS